MSKPFFSRNIGASGRWLRCIQGLLALILAALLWSPLSIPLVLIGGFLLIEALSSWCALRALLGKRDCPVR